MKISINGFIIEGENCNYEILRNEINSKGNETVKSYGYFGNLGHCFKKVSKLLIEKKLDGAKSVEEIEKLLEKRIELTVKEIKEEANE